MIERRKISSTNEEEVIKILAHLRLRGIGDCDEQRRKFNSTNEEEAIKSFAVRGRWSGLFMEGNFMFPLISLSISLCLFNWLRRERQWAID